MTIVLSGVPLMDTCAGDDYDLNGSYRVGSPSGGNWVAVGGDDNCLRLVLFCLDGVYGLGVYNSTGGTLIAVEYQVPSYGDDCCPAPGVYDIAEGGTFEIIGEETAAGACVCATDTSGCPMTYTAVLSGTPTLDGTYVLARVLNSGSLYYWARVQADESPCSSGPGWNLVCENASDSTTGRWAFSGSGLSWIFHMSDSYPCPTEGTFINALGYQLVLSVGGTPCT